MCSQNSLFKENLAKKAGAIFGMAAALTDIIDFRFLWGPFMYFR